MNCLSLKSGIVDFSQQSQLVRDIALILFCRFQLCGGVTGPIFQEKGTYDEMSLQESYWKRDFMIEMECLFRNHPVKGNL
jgi:hypothetical protein